MPITEDCYLPGAQTNTPCTDNESAQKMMMTQEDNGDGATNQLHIT